MTELDAKKATEDQIRKWLLDYAWFGTEETRVHEVNCIMAQNEWKNLDVQVERFMATRSGEETIEYDSIEASGWALSALYECHMEPHIDECPHKHPDQIKGI
jgi:hypothetical protein